VIDWTALRIGALEEAKVRDFDERRHVFLARASVAKNEKPVWLALQDVPRLTTEQRSTAD
jgi:hypothetical protein